jgi:hypothetical protein
MYKSRIKKWGLDKKHKAADMAFVLRIRNQREQLRKDTVFKIRGKVLDPEDITKYAKRKLRQKPNFLSDYLDDQKPPHIEFGDPCSCPTEKNVATITMQGEPKCKKCMMVHILRRLRHDLPSIVLRNENSRGPLGNGCMPAIGETTTIDPIEQASKSSNAASVVSRYAKSAIINHRTSANMIASPEYRLSSRFCSLITNLDNYPDQGGIHEACQLLHESFEVARTMINAQHPIMLQEIFCAALCLLRNGLRQVASMVMDFVTNVSIEQLDKDHPWSLVCGLLNVPDSELEPVLCHLYQLVAVEFAKRLGEDDFVAIQYSAGFSHDVLQHSDPDAAISRLTAIRSICEARNSSTHGVLGHVTGKLAKVLTEQGRLNQALALVNDWLQCATSEGEIIQALELLADIQLKVSQSTARYAEENIRRALKMAEDKIGKKDPYYMHLMSKLVKWLTVWGRNEEVQAMKTRLRDLLSREE